MRKMKKTAIAPSNIAFIKYWGRKNEALRLPENASISMNLSNLLTTTTVEFLSTLKKDDITINHAKNEVQEKRVIEHLDRIRKIANIQTFAKVVSVNNFPTGTGLSSSASGFAALTIAAAAAASLSLSEKELSIFARQGSGSACRSIPNGFVEWKDGDTSDTSYAVSLYPANYWEIADVVAVVSSSQKDVPSAKGQSLAQSSIFFETRKKNMSQKITDCKKFLQEKDFTKFGELVEQEALELHAIYLTSKPSLIYLLPETLKVIKEIKKIRENGLAIYFTLNTGQDVHIICLQKDIEKVKQLIEKIPEVKKTIVNYPATGATLVENDLF